MTHRFPPSNATGGDVGTRWASDWSDPPWLRVGLGSVTSFDRVQLVWEASYARAYQVQTSCSAPDGAPGAGVRRPRAIARPPTRPRRPSRTGQSETGTHSGPSRQSLSADPASRRPS
jgi:hypothetical protein